jgi:hypothetical protein
VNWAAVLGGTVLFYLYSFCTQFGITIASPLFVPIGLVLSIPVPMAVDVAMGKYHNTWMKSLAQQRKIGS